MATDKQTPQYLEEETDNEIIIESEDENCPEEDVVDTSDHNSDSEQIDKETEIDRPNNYYLGEDNDTKWRKEPRVPNVRTRVHNINIQLPGPKRDAKNVKTHTDFSTVLLMKLLST
jgi:hypothetical protein